MNVTHIDSRIATTTATMSQPTGSMAATLAVRAAHVPDSPAPAMASSYTRSTACTTTRQSYGATASVAGRDELGRAVPVVEQRGERARQAGRVAGA